MNPRQVGLIAFVLPVLLALFCAPHVGASQATADLTDGIEEIVLDNGLHIYVYERQFSPTFAAYYQFGVGGAMDPKGKSGIAHLLEHMMFKGSRSVGTLNPQKEKRLMTRLQTCWQELYRQLDLREDPFRSADEDRIAELEGEIERLATEHKQIIVKNEYDELMTRAGGSSMNASTGNDVTNYFLALPANQLEFWFKMESERLLYPVFREFYSERDVVHEERRLRTENQASGLAYEGLAAMMYQAHPYGTPIVGWSGDIERYDRTDAEDYFRTYYSPSNCTMVIVGDVEVAEVRRLAKKYLRRWKRQTLPRRHVTAEPLQRGARRQAIEFDAEPSLMMAWATVPAGHPDQYPLELLARLLGGMASARLDQELVQKQRIASRVYCYADCQRNAGAFTIGSSPRGEAALETIEAAVLAEIERLQNEGIDSEELDRAKVATEVRRVRRLDSNLWLAFSIGRAAGTAGSVDYIAEYEERILAVTSAQIQQVATEYLKPALLNVVTVERGADMDAVSARGRGGHSDRSDGPDHGRGGPPGERGAKHSKGFKRALAMVESADPIEIKIPVVGEDVERVELPSGITVFIKEDHAVPDVSLSMTFLGGANTLPVDELAPMALAARLLSQGGSAGFSPRELEERIDELGMNFNCWLGDTQSGASFWSLSRNFDEAYAVAVDILTQPRLDEERLEVLKGQHIEGMRRRTDRPGRAVRVLCNHVLTGDHPRLGRTATRAEIESITSADVRTVIDRYLGPTNMFVCAVGDFDKQEMLDRIEQSFGTWRAAADARRTWITRSPASHPGAYVVEKEIPQPAIRIVQEIGIDRTAPPEEHAAIEILNEILGGSGFRSRLMERLRSDEGLTYGIYSRFHHQGRAGVPGHLSIGYQTKREAVLHSIEVVVEEYAKICNEFVSTQEVQEQIQAWRNRFIFRFENEAYSVQRLMAHELNDYPYDHDSRQLDLIQEVTIADVLAVARKYLDPSRLTIAIFGSLNSEDEEELQARFGLTKLTREEVFSGGF